MRFLICWLLAMGWAATAAGGELTVGFGEADLTPELGKKPVYLAGFGHNRVARSVHDPIMARAVVLADGDDKIALVTVDLIGLFLHTVEQVREQLPGYRYVLVSATHNHEGPDTLGLWGPSPLQSGVDRDYLKRVVAGCVAAVRAADQARQPAVAHIGTLRVPELLHDSREPFVLHDELVVLRFTHARTARPLGILVQWNNHPEVLDSKNTALTADYPYFVVKQLRASQGCPVAYFTGTVGGLMTPLGLKVTDAASNELADGTFEKAERYAELLTQAAEKALRSPAPLTLTPFTARTRTVLVPVTNKLYQLAHRLGVLEREMFEWDGTPTPAEFRRTTDATRPVALKTEVGYLRLGELDVAVIPGEIYPELVLGRVQDPPDPGADFPNAPAEPAIYAPLTGKYRMLIGLGNDEIGYIIPKRQWDEKPPYCYGRKKPQYGEQNSVGPDAAAIICETFRELVKDARR